MTAFDFPGFGKSAPLEDAWSVGDYAAHAAHLLDGWGIRGARLIAHSFGGRVALKLLSERRDLFRSALLVGCAGVPPRRGVSYRAKVRAYRIAKKIAPRFAERRFGSPEYRSLSPLMRESYKKIVNEDLREEAKRIARPVLYLNGEHDRETPLSSVKILHECTAGSLLAVLKGCGHFAHLEEPLLFDLAAEEFLNDA